MKIVLVSLVTASLVTAAASVAFGQDTTTIHKETTDSGSSKTVIHKESADGEHAKTIVHKESADGEHAKTVVNRDDGSRTVIKRHGNRVKKVHIDPNGDKTIIKKSTY
jgi:hypothetical protein